MGIVMNMSDYAIESGSADADYSEDVMYAEWNPAVALVCEQQSIVSKSMPAGLACENVELFLQRMYACQR